MMPTFLKTILKPALILLMGLHLAGCSAHIQKNPPSDTVIAVSNGPQAAALKAAAEVYRESTGQQVVVVALGQDVYYDRVSAVLLAGLDDFDLLYLPVDMLPKWVSYHALRPFTKDNGFNTNLLQPWQNWLQIGGDVYGMPAQPALEVLWYRVDWLEEAGLAPPQTWEEFLTAAKALSRPPERFGAVIAAGELEAGADFAAYLGGFGAWAGVEGELLPVEQPQAQPALDFYLNLIAAGVVPPESVNFSRSQAVDALRQGRAAMAVLPLDSSAALLDCESSPRACSPAGADGAARSLLAAAPLPGMPAGQGLGSLSAWVIPLKAAHPQAAQDFAAWLNSPEGARAWAQGGGIPANRAVLQDGQALAEAPHLSLMGEVEVYHLPLPLTTNYEAMWNAYHQAIHSAAAGELTVAEALQSCAKDMRRVLIQGEIGVE